MSMSAMHTFFKNGATSKIYKPGGWQEASTHTEESKTLRATDQNLFAWALRTPPHYQSHSDSVCYIEYDYFQTIVVIKLGRTRETQKLW